MALINRDCPTPISSTRDTTTLKRMKANAMDTFCHERSFWRVVPTSASVVRRWWDDKGSDDMAEAVTFWSRVDIRGVRCCVALP
jgi:hypothetical protein